MPDPAPDSLPRHYPANDALTGVLSRRKFLEEAISEFRKFKRYGHPFALLIVDLDLFNQVNERYGTQAGDKVLEQMAASLSQMLREHDLLGRIGGEEFGILLIETELEAAQKIAERLRQTCAQLTFPLEDASFSLTASIGLSQVKPEDASFEDLFLRADNALTFAKQNGRNQVNVQE